jgi:hypothetical protein
LDPIEPIKPYISDDIRRERFIYLHFCSFLEVKGGESMSLRGKLEIEFDSIDSLCRQLYTELQRYGALERFIRYVIGYMDEDFLKRLRRDVERRMDELEEIYLRSWDADAIASYIGRLSPDAKKALEAIINLGLTTKEELMKATGFGPMKVAGVLAGMSNMAKKMGFKEPIVGTYVRVDGGWARRYRVEESFLNAWKTYRGRR